MEEEVQDENTQKIKELLHTIVENLVDSPEAIKINASGTRTLMLDLSVAKEDLGKVIGREGRTAQAIRKILGAACNKFEKKKVHLEILE